jgi:serine/threonine protein kinase/WD40 repeat protein
MTERTIFLAALEQTDPAERAAYLASACRGDAGLRSRVEALLGAHDGAGSFLEKPVVDGAATGDLDQDPDVEGMTAAPPEPPKATVKNIGPYKLLQKLGEGGMGFVYMAEQVHPVRRRVALKIIKAGMDSAQIVARFEQERQALAMMDHPNIAKVLDAGQTDGGRPFFVMELVKGVAITKYCDREHLTPSERLELFIPVCHAIHHAHQKGIIHRDLKPSNILIALYDGRPVPKVIDFGVAKATNQKLTERTMFTTVGSIVGTVEYMAPEQAELNNLDVDTRADIYSLGVVLYELLTGAPPFSSKRLRKAAFSEMLRIIREVEPIKPSNKVSSSGDLPAIAAKRKLEPKRLTRLIQGDLDWIAMKCLEKDRARRYESASTLGADIDRYLKNEPVLAGPPGAGYRVGKFLRRNKGPVAAGASVVLALVLGLVVSIFLAVWAKGAEDNAISAQQYAEEQVKVAGIQRDEARQANANLNKAKLQAVEQGKVANFQREEALNANAALRKAKSSLSNAFYAAQLNLMQNAWDADNIGRVRELLEQSKPAAGDIDLRQFEWHYWDRQSHAELQTVDLGAEGQFLGFSADAKLYFTLSKSKLAWVPGDGGFPPPDLENRDEKRNVSIWDTASGKRIHNFEVTASSLGSCRLAPDGKRLVAVSATHTTVLDARSGNQLWTQKTPPPLGLAPDLSVEFDPRSDLVVCLSGSEIMFERLGPTAGTIGGLGSGYKAMTLYQAEAGKKLGVINLTDGIVTSHLAFSPKGKRFAAVVASKTSASRLIKLWDVVEGKVVVQCKIASVDGTPFGSAGMGTEATPLFSPNGKMLAFLENYLEIPKNVKQNMLQPSFGLAARCALQVWDSETGKQLIHIKNLQGFHGGLAFSPDGTKLMAVNSETGDMQCWDAQTGMERFTVATQPGRARATKMRSGGGVISRAFDSSPVWSPDGKLFTAHGPGSAIRVWDDATGEERLTLKGHSGSITYLAFSSDQKRLYSVGSDGTMKTWDATVTPEKEGFSPTGAFGANGQRVAELIMEKGVGGGWPTGVRVWNTANWQELFTWKQSATAVCAGGITISANGKYLAFLTAPPNPKKGSTSDPMKVDSIGGFPPTPPPPPYAPDGEFAFRIFAIDGGKEIHAHALNLKANEGVPAFPLAISGDGKRLACVTQRLGLAQGGGGMLGGGGGPVPGFIPSDAKPLVKMWNTATGKELWSVQADVFIPGSEPRMVFSPDGTQVASVVNVGTLMAPKCVVKIWDAQRGKEIRTLAAKNNFLSPIAFSPDGKYLAVPVQLGSLSIGMSWTTLPTDVTIWEIATEKLHLSLKGHTSPVELLAFNSDGSRLATATETGFMMLNNVPELKIWETNTGVELLALQPTCWKPLSLAFTSRDECLLLAGMNDRFPSSLVLKTYDAKPRRGSTP